MLARTLHFSLLFIAICAFVEAKISLKTQEYVAPYLLPADHPVKEQLDRIFSQGHVLLNEKNMKRAGFSDAKPRKFTRLIVTRHPELPGYVVKAYLDSQQYHKRKPEYEHWIARIEGIRKINTMIDANGWSHLFKTPQKWIYQIPEVKRSKDYLTKNFIIIEEDMNLLSEEENLAYWKSSAVDQEQLQALYLVLKNVGLRDCAKPDNIPFSQDGRIAFIDTQSHGEKVPFSNLSSYLSSSNRTFWKELIKKN